MARLSAVWILTLATISGSLFCANATTDESISVELSVFSPFRPRPADLYIRLDGEMKRVVFPPTIRGETITYRGPNPIVFYRPLTLEDGTRAYAPAADIFIDQDKRQPFLIFNMRFNANGLSDIGIILMDGDTERFPEGTICLVNMTGVPMEGLVGSRRERILPGVSGPFKIENEGTFRLGLALEFNERVYPAFLNTVTLDTSTRQWMFVAPPLRPGSTRVQVRFVEDHSLLMRDPG